MDWQINEKIDYHIPPLPRLFLVESNTITFFFPRKKNHPGVTNIFILSMASNLEPLNI